MEKLIRPDRECDFFVIFNDCGYNYFYFDEMIQFCENVYPDGSKDFISIRNLKVISNKICAITVLGRSEIYGDNPQKVIDAAYKKWLISKELKNKLKEKNGGLSNESDNLQS